MNALVCVAENLVNDPANSLQGLIDRYCESVEAQPGVKVSQVKIPMALTVPQMAEIARGNGTDPVQLFGRCPWAMVYNAEDGHGNRKGSMDRLLAVNASDVAITHDDGSYELKWGVSLSRAVGRADFFGLPEGAEIPLMRAWMEYLLAVRAGTISFGNSAILDCLLDYLFNGVGDRLISIMEAVSGKGSCLDTRGQFTFKNFFQTYAGFRYLLGALYDGAEPFAVGEYNTGGFSDFASGLVRMAVVLMFCSEGWHPLDWHLQRDLLIGGSIAVTYGTGAPPSLSAWSTSVGIGQALILGGSEHTVTGDAMFRRPVIGTGTGGDDLSQTQIDAINAATDAKIAAAIKPLADAIAEMKGTTSTNTTNNSGGTVINVATWHAANGQGGSADVLKYVREMVAAGKPVVATNAMMGAYYGVSERNFDPAFSFQKVLHIEGTRSGTSFADDIIEGSSKIII